MKAFSKNGFTLVELIVVIAILGVLSTVLITVINPLQQLRKSRDTGRKTNITDLSRRLEEYAANNNGMYPGENACDTSIGTACPGTGTTWEPTSPFYTEMINKGYAKVLPVDPVNTQSYYYMYEPLSQAEGTLESAVCATGTVCRYWIGARLEAGPTANTWFRCSDKESLAAGVGCKEVSGASL